MEGGLPEMGRDVETPGWTVSPPSARGLRGAGGTCSRTPAWCGASCVLCTCKRFSWMELCRLGNHALLNLSLMHHSVGAEAHFPNLSLAELTAFLC